MQPEALTKSAADEEPQFVLAAPGSITPRRRLTQVLAAGSLLAVAFRAAPPAALQTTPPAALQTAPAVVANSFTVSNLNPAGTGSLLAAVKAAAANPGPDTITFNPSLAGTIPLTGTLLITGSVDIQGPGPGQLSVSGSNAYRVFYLSPLTNTPFTATISGLTIRNGSTTQSGAGVDASAVKLTLDDVAIISNTAHSANGGGIYVSDRHVGITSSLTLRNSLVSGNIAGKGGGLAFYGATGGVLIQNSQIISNTRGGVFGFYPHDVTIEDASVLSNTNTFGRGGGIYLLYPAGGAQLIRRTTIAGNTAGVGGGLAATYGHQPLTLEDTTISGNQSVAGGGGVLVTVRSPTTIRNSTIVSNSAGVGGGVAAYYQPVVMTNTIVAGNSAPVGQDITGTFQLKYDLVQVTGGATITNAGGNLFGLDPLLGPLANNGGPTQTRLPLAGSPVIDTGDTAFAPPPSTDQRGQPRVANGRIDIGAVEGAVSSVLKLFLPLVRR